MLRFQRLPGDGRSPACGTGAYEPSSSACGSCCQDLQDRQDFPSKNLNRIQNGGRSAEHGESTKALPGQSSMQVQVRIQSKDRPAGRAGEVPARPGCGCETLPLSASASQPVGTRRAPFPLPLFEGPHC